jgi:aryl-alcohol dehydrogenase-like predicted oxidoreductase
MNRPSLPSTISSLSRQCLVKTAVSLAPLSALLFNPQDAISSQYIGKGNDFPDWNPVVSPGNLDAIATSRNGDFEYSMLGDMKVCKIINGMWQVSGAHGYNPKPADVVGEMSRYAELGFTSFDLADIYGPAEVLVGEFTKSSAARECLFFTKWVPRPQEITKEIAVGAIEKSMRRMRSERLDLLQFHWWDYADKNYYAAIHQLMDLQEQEKIRYLGLTNFDTYHMIDLVDQGAPLVSNQVIVVLFQ